MIVLDEIPDFGISSDVLSFSGNLSTPSCHKLWEMRRCIALFEFDDGEEVAWREGALLYASPALCGIGMCRVLWESDAVA